MSQPEIFIIESLEFDDERAERFEGRIISEILTLSGKHCEYCYIRTKRELKELLNQFETSRYRVSSPLLPRKQEHDLHNTRRNSVYRIRSTHQALPEKAQTLHVGLFRDEPCPCGQHHAQVWLLFDPRA